MDRKTVADRFEKLLREHLCVPAETEIDDQSDLADDLDADSLDMIELGLLVEETFRVDLEEAELDYMGDRTNFGELVDHLAGLPQIAAL